MRIALKRLGLKSSQRRDAHISIRIYPATGRCEWTGHEPAVVGVVKFAETNTGSASWRGLQPVASVIGGVRVSPTPARARIEGYAPAATIG